MRIRFMGLLCLCLSTLGFGQHTPLIQNAYARNSQSLDGDWHYLIDPYETGYRNHRRWEPFDEFVNTKASAAPYWANKQIASPSDRIEYNFDTAPTLRVPGDWNHQAPELLYYEGSLWYERDFDFSKRAGERYFLYFGAVNYRADVYLNGTKVGVHEGPYDPFNFEVTDQLLEGKNEMVVRADNRRAADRVPGLTTDWWNYGGITRSVKILSLPQTFIRDYFIQLDSENHRQIKARVQLDGPALVQDIQIVFPRQNQIHQLRTNAQGWGEITFPAADLELWYPERPSLHEVMITCQSDTLSDRIGFRSITTQGTDLLLNGKRLFLRGISLHEENPLRAGRAHSKADAELLLGWAKDLNCNMVRLAHYPHNEHMPRLADEIGLLLWEEVPVYWGINYTNLATYQQAENQLRSLITRDKNRASVIIWSVANETPREDPNRLVFLQQMAALARQTDPTRLVTAALDRTEDKAASQVTITDPFARDADLVSVNEYIGWYGSTPERIAQMRWDLSEHNKPFFISEFGAGALYGLRGSKEQRWTEDYQAWMYEETLDMLEAIPSLRGMTPWILVDFRSPRRNLPVIQDGWNRKGLLSEQGDKKLAYYILRDYYAKKAQEYAYELD